jgi:signal transduction protein with GAF and PtsI domain
MMYFQTVCQHISGVGLFCTVLLFLIRENLVHFGMRTQKYRTQIFMMVKIAMINYNPS